VTVYTCLGMANSLPMSDGHASALCSRTKNHSLRKPQAPLPLILRLGFKHGLVSERSPLT